MEQEDARLTHFSRAKVVIIGDVMLDRYVDGSVTRISAEAPVPIVSVERENFALGGAANVAANAAALGAQTTLFGFVGEDSEGAIVRDLLQEKKIRYILGQSERTTQKTRLISKGHQLIRFDREETSDKLFRESTYELLAQTLEDADIIIVSDYEKGVVHAHLMHFLTPYFKKVIVDPRPGHTALYKGVSLITPNEKESYEMSGHTDTTRAGRTLYEQLGARILLTMGEKGMTLFSEEELHIPTYAREVFDVVGAGDTVIATVGVALAAGNNIENAAHIANHAAGIAVEKRGTYAVSFRELRDALHARPHARSEKRDVLENIKNKNDGNPHTL